jgi:hypothetical protein
MNYTKTGGPAFPVAIDDQVLDDGMTLRDYFAAKAMQALITRADKKGNESDYANTAYLMADAMLKARTA